MKHRILLKRFVEKIVNLVVKSGKDILALHYVSDEVILAALQSDGRLPAIHDPLAYVNFLRECIQPLTFSTRELKGKEDLESVESKRFATLLDSIQSGLPPVDFPLAKEIGLVADRYRSLYFADRAPPVGRRYGFAFLCFFLIWQKGPVAFQYSSFVSKPRLS
jgi:hypothetical protein